jgi:transposase-like protein
MSLPAKRKKGEGNWTQADKDRAVAAYAAVGHFERASTLIGIPENTIRYWSKQDWFQEALRRVDRADTHELKTVYTRIAKKAITELEDRLDNGDTVITKDGELVQKPIGGKELAIIAAVATDKRKVTMDEPETVALQSTNEKLATLLQKFIAFASAKDITSTSEEVKDA